MSPVAAEPRSASISEDWTPVQIGRWLAREVDTVEREADARQSRVEAKLEEISGRLLYGLAGLATACVLLVIDIAIRTASGG